MSKILESTNREKLQSIQYLRAIAALMVVVHHARNPKDWLYSPLSSYDGFAWGVDIFFIISGFIMYIAARKDDYQDFIAKRVIRVVPLYWIATVSLLALNQIFNNSVFTTELAIHITKSLFFIPDFSPSYAGGIFPYLIVGWTLNYEMFFYLIFCIGILTKKILPVTIISIMSLFLMGVFLEFTTPIFLLYTQPIILEFLCGLLIGYFYQKGFLRKRLSWLAGLGFIGLLSTPLLENSNYIMAGRIICGGVLVIGCLSLKINNYENKGLNLLGDASYSIYLTHGFLALGLADFLWKKVPITGVFQFIGWLVLVLTLSTVIGCLAYLYFEKPVIKWLRGAWRKYRSRTTSNQPYS